MKRSLLKRSFLLTTMILVLVFAVTAIASATEPTTPDFVIEDGKTQPFVDMENLIHEEVWVEAPVDSDGDGKRDLVYIKITRPSETENGLKSPAIIDPTPYATITSGDYFNTVIMKDPDADFKEDNPDTTDLDYEDDIAYVAGEDFHTYDEIVAANFNPTWLPAGREAKTEGDATRVNSWVSATNWKQYFISRGYAAIRVNTIGDHNSEGLITVGEYDEAIAMAAIVDWLNGRVKAFTSPAEGEGWVEVKADWASGKAAFNGTSYPGQLSLMAAMTGVDGLETIIPEAAPINWYDYYRANGGIQAPGGYQGEDLVAHMYYCQSRQGGSSVTKPDESTAAFIQEYIEHMDLMQDRVTGDYTKFWDARNKAIYADGIECSVLITHGLNDWNVKFKHAAQLVEICKEHDIEWKAFFHYGPHTSALNYDGFDVYEKMHGWLDYYLLGIENGMPDAMPTVSIVNNVTNEWEEYDTWPIEDNRFTTFYLNGYLNDEDPTVGFISSNRLTDAEVSFKDQYIASVPAEDRDTVFGGPNSDNTGNMRKWLNYIVGGDEDTANMDLTKSLEDRLLYLSEPLEENVRLSGTTKVTLEVKADKTSGPISVMVVEYGEIYESTYTTSNTTRVDLGNGREASLRLPVAADAPVPYRMVTVGAADIQNPNPSGDIWLDCADTNFVPEYWYQTTDIEADEYNTYVFELTATDYVFTEGNQIGIIIYSTDARYTNRPFNPAEYTVDLGKSKIELPLIGSVKDPMISGDFVIEDGKTQPFVSQSGLIHEEVWVEAPVDSDGDGKRDLVYIKITRPGEGEYGLKSPAILDPTPYDSTTSSFCNALSKDYVDEDGNPLYANDYEWFNWYIMQNPDADYKEDNPDTTDLKYEEDIAYVAGEDYHTYDEIVAADFNPEWLPAQRNAKRIGEANRIGAWLSATDWKQYFLSRGYAAIRINTIGDFNSEGLITVGEYDEALAMAAIVDWLNGRVKGFADPEATVEVKANWSNGKAAFNGTSYPGQLSLMAAMTGVDGLETIIPEAAPINWYDYYRANGGIQAPGGYQGEDLAAHMVYCQTRQQDKYSWWTGEVTATSLTKPTPETHDFIGAYIEDMLLKQDRETGDYSQFWDARNKAIYADGIECSVLITHGLNDWNVKFKHAAQLVEICKEHDIEWKAFFHYGPHTSALRYDGFDVYEKMHGWLDYYLLGIENGMPDAMPTVSIVNNVTNEWEEYDTWPIEDNKFTTIYFNNAGEDPSVGTLSNFDQAEGEVSFKDQYIASIPAEERDEVFGGPNSDNTGNMRKWLNYIVGGDEDTANMDLTKPLEDRLLYLSAPLEESVRLSGTTKVTLEVKADKTSGPLSVMVVEYGEIYESTYTTSNTTLVDLGNGREASLRLPVAEDTSVPYRMVTVGAADIQNPNPSGDIWLDCADTNFVPEYWYQTTDIDADEYNTYVFELTATDYVFTEGNQIGIIIYSTDARYTNRPFNPAEYTVDLGKSKIELPLIGDLPEVEGTSFDLVIEDGETQPFVTQSALIHEELWVEAPVDSDGDGKRDLVYIKITRPGEGEYGLKSPAILDPTPYDSTTSSYCNELSKDYVDEDGNPLYANDWEWFNWYIMQNPDADFKEDNPDTTDLSYEEDIAYVAGEDYHTYDEIVAANFNPPWLPAQRIAESEGEANRINAWLGATNWKQYFLSRGFAAIRVNTIGDFNSEGLITVGEYDEALAMAAVVDWLNGRVKAFTDPDGKVEVKADWASGKAAMNGTSYPGQLSLMGAISGVDGLETIIPEAAPINWYDYYRANGGIQAPGGYQGEDLAAHMVYCQTRQQDKYSRGVVSVEAKTKPTPEAHDFIGAYIEDMLLKQDRETGDYSKFWDARNKAVYAKHIECSVLITHGLNDWNVKFKHAAQLVEACKANGIEWKAIFHSGAHSSALGYDGIDVYGKLQGWLDHYLVGIDNGMPDAMPTVSIVNNVTKEWEEYDTWPIEDNAFTTLYFNDLDGDATVGSLGTAQMTNTAVSFEDQYIASVPAEDRDTVFGGPNSDNTRNMNKWLNYIVGGDEDIANMDLTKPLEDRLLYLSEPLEENVRLSGTTKVTLEVKADKTAGPLSVMVIDYGEVYSTSSSRINRVDLGNGRQATLSLPIKGSASPFKMVTVGAADIQNPNPSGKIWIDCADTNFVPEYWYQTTAIEANEYNTYVFELTATDYVFEAGHQIGIIIYSTDARYTNRAFDATEFTVDLGKSKIDLPLIGEISEPELEYDFVIEDNKTQPFVNQSNLIHEEVWIESPQDTDNDGQRDLIYARITRPGETEFGLKSPSIIQVTPYTRTNGSVADGYLVSPDIDYNHPDNPDTTDLTYADIAFDLEGRSHDDIVAANFDPEWLPAQRVAESVGEANRINAWLSATNWRSYFVSRGYAAINVSSIGDTNSEGLVTVGDYDEAIAAAAIVDWLNGRIKGFTSADATVEVKADWSNGKAAMNGTSYNGALPIAAAITGVEGLETIIPEAPPVNWYDYYRTNGMVWAPGAYQGEDLAQLQVYCQTRHLDPTSTKPTEAETSYIQEYLEDMIFQEDRTTGDYNTYWDARNMAVYAEDIRCSILMTHGYADWNVKFKHTAQLWEMCELHDVTHKAIFHPGGHSSALSYDGIDIYAKLQGWMDYYLLGIENGMPDAMPNVTMINLATMEWEEYDTWPIGGNEFTTLYLNNDLEGDATVGTISAEQYTEEEVSFEDEFIPSIPAEQRDPEGENVFGYMASDRGAAVTQWENLIVAGDKDVANMDLSKSIKDRLLYVGAPLEEEVRLSGTTKVTLKVKADKNVGAISAMIVDYGEVYGTSTQRGTTKVDLGNGRQASLNLPVLSSTAAPFKVVTRGSVDVQNPNPSGKIWLDSADTNFIPEYWYQTTAIETGEYYDYVFELMPTDYVFQEGHQIGIIIYGSDARYTTRPFDATEFTVDLGASQIDLPIIGSITEPEKPEPIEPTVEEVEVDAEELAAEGGEITITLSGTDLPDRIKVGLFDGEEAIYSTSTSGSETEQTASVVAPANSSEEEKSYTVKYSMDEGETWIDGCTITVAGVEVEDPDDPGDPDQPIVPPTEPEVTEYTITVRESDGGYIDPSGKVKVEEGKDLTINFYPDFDHEVSAVFVDGESVGAIDSYTFEDVQSDHTLRVVFGSIEVIGDDKDDDDKDDDKDEDKDDKEEEEDKDDDKEEKPEEPVRVNPFIDVTEGDWFYNDVLDSYYAGLINGRTANTYVPDGNITIAEAIKLASTMHQKYTTGAVTLSNGAEVWYSSYVDYAVANGIIKAGEYADMNAMATRAQYAVIFAAALPAEALPAINAIEDGKIPDVKMADSYGAAVYKLYNAGVLRGNDAVGTFAPMTNIKRSEVATIVNRMMNPEKRVTLAL